MKHELVFVGECRSPTARARDWSWKDGRLAAKPLFEALRAMGVDPNAQWYSNIYKDPTDRHPDRRVVNPIVAAHLRKTQSKSIIVALGARVSAELARLGVDHVALVHPAARGRIRKRERYVAHVAEKLRPALERGGRR